jgi:hypothetical protein
LNDYLIVRDSSKKVVGEGWIKAAGSGETLSGSELVTNGTFGADTNWTKQSGWTIAGGVAVGTASNDTWIYQTVARTANTLYKITFDLTFTGGILRHYPDDNVLYSADYTTAGSKTIYFVKPGSGSPSNILGFNGVAGAAFTGTIDNVSVQSVTAPSNTGVTIVSTRGGSTYNWAVKNSSANPNDSSGFTYEIRSGTGYGELIYSTATVSGTLHIATKDGEAMFFHDSIDFSAYAGTDSGSTKYKAVFYGGTGIALGYIGAVGAGKSLDAEIATGTLVSGRLYEITATESNHFGTGLIVGSAFTSAGTETCDANNKVKAFLDVAATGLHLMSAKDGTTRNLNRLDAGFGKNTVTSVKIYRATE